MPYIRGLRCGPGFAALMAMLRALAWNEVRQKNRTIPFRRDFIRVLRCVGGSHRTYWHHHQNEGVPPVLPVPATVRCTILLNLRHSAWLSQNPIVPPEGILPFR